MKFIETLSWAKNPFVINAALFDLKKKSSKGETPTNPHGFIVAIIQYYQRIEKRPLPHGVNEKLIPTELLKDLRLRDYLISVSMASISFSV